MMTTYMQSQKMLGTTIELRGVASAEEVVDVWFFQLWNKISDFNARYSRFLPNSELSQLNARAGEQIAVSDEFRELLKTARRFGDLTNGLFNPFTLPLLQRAGYTQSLVDQNQTAPTYIGHEVPTYFELEVGDDWVRIPKKSALDLGGIGKGYCADLLKAVAPPEVSDYCFSLGGDILMYGEEVGKPWEIEVESFVDSQMIVATYTNSRPICGLATSGIYRQYKDSRVHHLIDPRTQEAVRSKELLSCTVVADTTTAADVFASCILIGGIDTAREYYDAGLVHSVLLQSGNSDEPIILGEGYTIINSV